MLKLKNSMKLTISHQPVRVLNATSKRKGQEETFKPRLQGTGRDNESTVALERRDLGNGFMTVEREKWPNARVGPADGGGLLGQRSQYNDYHVIVLYLNYRMSEYGQIVIGVEIVEKKGLKAEKTEMLGLRC